MNRSLFALLLLLVASCASPREKTYQTAVRDYQRSERKVAAYARTEVKQLVTATRVFHATVGRWPQTFMEFGRWVTDTSQPLDLLAFDDVTFAALNDGSVQIHYDVNCSRFNSNQYQFVQTGTINVSPR